MIADATVWCATGMRPNAGSRPASAPSRFAGRAAIAHARPANLEGADPLHLGGPAGLPEAHEEPRGAVALALPEGRVDRRQFEEALAAPLGPGAPGLSAATVRRPGEAWQAEHERWQRRDLATHRYVYLWADGVYFTPRLEHERQCPCWC